MTKPCGTLTYDLTLLGGAPATTIDTFMQADKYGNKFAAAGLSKTDTEIEVSHTPFGLGGAGSGGRVTIVQTRVGAGATLDGLLLSINNQDAPGNDVTTEIYVRIWNHASMAV